MSRAVWFVAGAGAGVYAMVKGRRAAEALTPEGMRERWQALGVGARLMAQEVAQAKAEKEVELRERLLPAGPRTPELGSTTPRAATTTPGIHPATTRDPHHPELEGPQ